MAERIPVMAAAASRPQRWVDGGRSAKSARRPRSIASSARMRTAKPSQSKARKSGGGSRRTGAALVTKALGSDHKKVRNSGVTAAREQSNLQVSTQHRRGAAHAAPGRRVSEYEGGVIHDHEGFRRYTCSHNHGRSARAGGWFEAAVCERRERPCDEDGSLPLLSVSCLLSQWFESAHDIR